MMSDWFIAQPRCGAINGHGDVDVDVVVVVDAAAACTHSLHDLTILKHHASWPSAIFHALSATGLWGEPLRMSGRNGSNRLRRPPEMGLATFVDYTASSAKITKILSLSLLTCASPLHRAQPLHVLWHLAQQEHQPNDWRRCRCSLGRSRDG